MVLGQVNMWSTFGILRTADDSQTLKRRVGLEAQLELEVISLRRPSIVYKFKILWWFSDLRLCLQSFPISISLYYIPNLNELFLSGVFHNKSQPVWCSSFIWQGSKIRTNALKCHSINSCALSLIYKGRSRRREKNILVHDYLLSDLYFKNEFFEKGWHSIRRGGENT